MGNTSMPVLVCFNCGHLLRRGEYKYGSLHGETRAVHRSPRQCREAKAAAQARVEIAKHKQEVQP